MTARPLSRSSPALDAESTTLHGNEVNRSRAGSIGCETPKGLARQCQPHFCNRFVFLSPDSQDRLVRPFFVPTNPPIRQALALNGLDDGQGALGILDPE